MEEEVEKLSASEEMDDFKETEPSRQNRTEAHMNPQGWWQDAQVQDRWIPNTERRSRYKHLCLTQKLSPTDNCSQRKNYFSPVESYWVCKPHVRLASYPAVEMANAKKFNGIFGYLLSHSLGIFLFHLSSVYYYSFRYHVFMGIMCVWACMSLCVFVLFFFIWFWFIWFFICLFAL